MSLLIFFVDAFADGGFGGHDVEERAGGFVDDPAEPEAVTRATLPAYMQRWVKRTRALGGDNQWRLAHESRIDKNGILTDWEWWEVIDSGLQGAALVLTGNAGVLLERITYFDRDMRHGHDETNSPLAP